jgi:transcriptional regulator with XRE-family HTH domain
MSIKIVMQSTVSKVLHEKLKGKNLSEIARQLGIAPSVLADWVHARRTPSFKNVNSIVKLADYLGISLEALLLGKESERKLISAVTFSEDDREYKISIERIK